MASPILFDKAFFDDLEEAIEYEMWFLEAAYDIAGRPLFHSWPDQLIYTPGVNKPTVHAYATGNIVIGDWRPGFLNAGSPLVFVTSFKLLDMFMDHVLIKNGFAQTFRFQQKISRLKMGIQFPDFIESRPWLKERIIGFYETLEPLRGTVIHARNFTATGGNLKVSSSKGGVVGPEITVSREDLRSLAIHFISILHYVDGTWILDELREKTLRWKMDTLQQFHGLALLGQLEPFFLTTRVYIYESLSYNVDLKTIREDVKIKFQNRDAFFDLRVVLVNLEKRTLASCLIPWSIVAKAGDILNYEHDQMMTHLGDTPGDIKAEEIFQTLVGSTGSGQ